MSETYCCPMRARFLLGIVLENLEAPEPVDVIDFLDFDQKTPSGKPVLRIKFCPFCGKQELGPMRVAK